MKLAKYVLSLGLKVKGSPFMSVSKYNTYSTLSRILPSWSRLNREMTVLPSNFLLTKCQRACSQLSPDSGIVDEADNEEEDEEPRERKRENNGRLHVIEVDLESSIRYMKSNAYEITYGDAKVWMPYRRNFAGPYPPKKTRKTCIRGGVFTAGNPCPLCRDEYLVIHEKNVDLLNQFIDAHTGQVLSYEKTGICQKRHKQLLIAVLRAYDQGYLEKRLPFREYNYADYMKQT